MTLYIYIAYSSWVLVLLSRWLINQMDEGIIRSGRREHGRRETMQGLRITGTRSMCVHARTWILQSINFVLVFAVLSFTELAPKLLKIPNVKYLLSEVLSQDPLERYFSKQRHHGGSNENPTAEQGPLNAMMLIQQQSINRDIRTMNVERLNEHPTCSSSDFMQPLLKRHRYRS